VKPKKFKFEKELKKLPWLLKGKDLWQNKFHDFDVYKHTLEFVKHLKKLTDDPDLICAGYLHDVAKPVVAELKYKDSKIQEKEKGKPYHSFHGHEKKGEEMVLHMDSNFFKKYGLSQKRIARLVAVHYSPMKGIKKMRKSKNYQEFLNNFYKLKKELESCDVSKQDILLMFLADRLAQGEGCIDKEELFAIRECLLDNDSNLKKIYSLKKSI